MAMRQVDRFIAAHVRSGAMIVITEYSYTLPAAKVGDPTFVVELAKSYSGPSGSCLQPEMGGVFCDVRTGNRFRRI